MNLKHILFKLLIFHIKIIPKGMYFTVLKGPLRGYKWIAGAAAGAGKGLSVILGLSEPEQIKIVKESISKNDICFDIGANVGLYTLLFARYSKKVYAFEPLPRNISYLYRTLALNKVKNAIIVPCAVADINGLYWFQKGQHYSEGKLNNKGSQPVLVNTLDDFILKFKVIPNVLKIDVEGTELSVLKGARNSLLEFKPKIFLSTHEDEIKIKCLKFLKELKYQEINPLNTNSIETATQFGIL